MLSCEWFTLMKPLIFWTWRDDGVPNNGENEGSETRSSLIIENVVSQPPSTEVEGESTRATSYNMSSTRYSVRNNSTRGVRYRGEDTRYSMFSTRYQTSGACPTGHIEADLS